jgi:hypothetical protein
VAILLNALWPNSKPQHHLADGGDGVLLVLHETDSGVELKIDISMNLHFNMVRKKSFKENEGKLPLCSILH